jgi:hypothetical protein
MDVLALCRHGLDGGHCWLNSWTSLSRSLLTSYRYWNGMTFVVSERFASNNLAVGHLTPSIHEVCHRLCDASFARPVWLNLAKWYSATNQPRPFLPEKPLNLYSSSELEHLVLRWKAGWTRKKPTQRSFSIYVFSQHIHLVEGGR